MAELPSASNAVNASMVKAKIKALNSNASSSAQKSSVSSSLTLSAMSEE